MPSLEKHFDQLYHVIRAEIENVPAAGSIDSIEIDLELPKGYIAKPKIVRIRTFTKEMGAGTANVVNDIEAALIRDPDDITTVEIPNNAVQHDVIMDFKDTITYILDTTNHYAYYHNNNPIEYLYLEEAGLDVVTARNMRFNVTGSDAIAVDIDVTIWYTLEAITKGEVLEILDIL